MNHESSQCNYYAYFKFIAASADYIYFSDEFILTNTSQQAVAVISIVDDNLLEIDETFRAEISLVLMEDQHCVVLLPSAADVTILDNDSELPFPIAFVFPDMISTNVFIPIVAVIGFVPDNYCFTEGIGLVNLTLEVTPDFGQLGREVTIGVHIQPVSAISKPCITVNVIYGI